MNDKPKRYSELEDRIWTNLNNSGILQKILEKSVHAYDLSNYVGIKLSTEFGFNTQAHKYMIWIQINIEQEEAVQPVTPKLYRISENEAVQRDLCDRIWKGISEDDIKYVALISAEEYDRGNRYLDVSHKIAMNEFLPKLQNEAIVELNPKFSQFKVYPKN